MLTISLTLNLKINRNLIHHSYTKKLKIKILFSNAHNFTQQLFVESETRWELFFLIQSVSFSSHLLMFLLLLLLLRPIVSGQSINPIDLKKIDRSD